MAQTNMRATWNGGVIQFRDDRYSPQEGASLWELAPILAAMDPASAFFLDDDFLGNFDAVGAYTKTATTGTTLLINAAGGVVEASTAATLNDVTSFQSNSESVQLAAGKPAFFEARAQLSDATASAMVVGLCKTNTTLFTAISDGVYFSKQSGGTALSFNVAKSGSTTQQTNLATLANSTYMRLGFYFDGAGNVTPYVNGVAGIAVATNVPNTQTLTPTFGVQAGAGAVKKLDVDYYQFMQAR